MSDGEVSIEKWGNGEPAWTREHDALIARVAEGWIKAESYSVEGAETVYYAYDDYFLPGGTGLNDVVFLPNYLTDLTAIARAQEAWRLQDPSRRWFETTSRVRQGSEACCRMCQLNPHERWRGYDPIESAARAWATWRACGGVE